MMEVKWMPQPDLIAGGYYLTNEIIVLYFIENINGFLFGNYLFLMNQYL